MHHIGDVIDSDVTKVRSGRQKMMKNWYILRN